MNQYFIYLKGIERFRNLKEITISSCSLERIEGLTNLSQLRILNLSCNKIRVINSLQGLRNLEKITLSHNKIVSLKNLNQVKKAEKQIINKQRDKTFFFLLHLNICVFSLYNKLGGSENKVRALDLRDNKIDEINELSHLNT